MSFVKSKTEEKWIFSDCRLPPLPQTWINSFFLFQNGMKFDPFGFILIVLDI